MRRSDDDLLRIDTRHLDRLGQDDLWRLVVICRDDPDPKKRKRAQEAWAMLLAKDIDRVRSIVTLFRHPDAPQVRVEHDDVDDVVIASFERLLKMLKTLRGEAMGEYRGALKMCVFRQCQDYCRDAMKHDMRRAGSLDDVVTDKEGDARPRFEEDIAEQERQRIADEEQQERESERRDRVVEALGQMENANRRQVVELTLQGRSTEQIMAELDISRDNVYQRRKRGLEDLGDILNGDVEL